MDLNIRPRRLRSSAVLRKMVRETRVDASSLIYPIFVKEGTGIREEIPTMPGQYRYSVDRMGEKLQSLWDAGVSSVMFFGIPDYKDELGSGAYADDGIVQKVLRQARQDFPEMLLITDVCMCEYTSHGHCGFLCECDRRGVPLVNKRKDSIGTALKTGSSRRGIEVPQEYLDNGCNPEQVERACGFGYVDNDRSLELLAKTAVSHARAGADMVAPSDMMDGRVAAIRAALDAEGFLNVPIMSYAVKYASAFYGPFHDAAGSTPAFGDRKSYQMDYHNSREGIKEALLDVEEGADIIMVKPAMSYLDMVAKIKEVTDVPIASYSVSGEYAMIKAGAQLGYIDEEKIICETAVSAFRAGCDIYLTYFAEEIANYIREGKIG